MKLMIIVLSVLCQVKDFGTKKPLKFPLKVPSGNTNDYSVAWIVNVLQLFTEADGVEQWITEKEKMLDTMVPGKDIEDCEIMKHR